MSRFDPKPIPLITWGNMAPPFRDHSYFENRKHFPFEPETGTFSLVNAWWMSEASLLAYADEAFARPRFEAAGFDEVRFFSGHSTQCYVASNQRFAVVAFRGTECDIDQGPEAVAHFMADLAVDMDIRLVQSQGDGKVHRGFHDALDEIWPELAACLGTLSDRGCPLWVTGHSLGGALAILTVERHTTVRGIHTFGAPRVGNSSFADAFPKQVHRFSNNNDLVPHLPTFPYADLGELHYIDRHGVLQAGVAFWQRLKDELQGHIDCLVDNVRHLNQDWRATLPDGLKDHTPLLYALHIWNNLIAAGQGDEPI